MALRILHAIASVDPATGGPIEALKQLAAANQQRGHVVEVVSLDAPDSPWVQTCPVRCHAVGPGRGFYGYTPNLTKWLAEHRTSYDAVIVDGLWQYQSFGVWRALHGTSTPYFVFTHGMLDPWFKRTYPLKHLKKWAYWPWAEYRVLRDARAVLFTCEQERLLARESFWLYRAQEQVVSFGTSRPVGDMSLQQAAFAERFPELKDKRCLLFLGRVHPKKGLDLLLEAFAVLLRQSAPTLTGRLHLVVAGPADDAYGQAMKALAQQLGLVGRVSWAGMLSGDLKWGAFYNAEAFVLSSHQENFGIAVAEALACGRPVLISDQVNIWREIKQDGAGWVAHDDVKGTLKLLQQWAQATQAELTAMGQQAQQCFESRFAIDKAAESLMTVVAAHVTDPQRSEAIRAVSL